MQPPEVLTQVRTIAVWYLQRHPSLRKAAAKMNGSVEDFLQEHSLWFLRHGQKALGRFRLSTIATTGVRWLISKQKAHSNCRIRMPVSGPPKSLRYDVATEDLSCQVLASIDAHELLQALPERWREGLVRHYLEDEPLGDIAFAWGVSKQAVDQVVKRAAREVIEIVRCRRAGVGYRPPRLAGKPKRKRAVMARETAK